MYVYEERGEREKVTKQLYSIKLSVISGFTTIIGYSLDKSDRDMSATYSEIPCSYFKELL